MSRRIWIYTFALLSLNTQYDLAWTKHFLEILQNCIFIVCFLAQYGSIKTALHYRIQLRRRKEEEIRSANDASKYFDNRPSQPDIEEVQQKNASSGATGSLKKVGRKTLRN